MADYVDNPLLFNKYFSDFYDRVYNYWYWLKQHKHSQPIYIVIEEIAEKDLTYYAFVSELFADDVTLSAKVETCRKIHTYLF